jgi:hypothetical protein
MNDYPSMLSPFQERRRSPAALSSAMESPRLLECALARGDGITCDRTSFAEVRESVDGTFRKWQAKPPMSAHRGRPDIDLERAEIRQ